jgi:hypothetical protein
MADTRSPIFCIRSAIRPVTPYSSIALPGIASADPRCRVGGRSPGRTQGYLAAAYRGTGRRFCAVWFRGVVVFRRETARVDPRRSRRRPVIAMGTDRIRHRHRFLFCRGSRAGCACYRGRRDSVRRGGVFAAAAKNISDRCDRGDGGGFRHSYVENRADCAWRIGTADVFGVAVGFCRNPRHPRAHRPFCLAGRANGKPARKNEAGTGSAVGAQRHRAGGRQFCGIEGAAAAAANTVSKDIQRRSK